MDFTRFVVILLAVWFLREKLLKLCIRVRLHVRGDGGETGVQQVMSW